MSVKLYYYAEGSNFGDAVNPILLEKIFKHKCIPADPGNAGLFMIGSILNKALVPRKKIFKRLLHIGKPPLYIWSSGFIHDQLKTAVPLRQMKVCALRGRLSLRLLEKITSEKFQIPLGDGGLLISKLLDKKPEKKYAVGIVPHFVDENMPELREVLKKTPESTLISPLGDPLECAGRIAECETIISSSLHGLIAADSFGIPNRQLVLSDRIVGGLFKYNDYYSVFDRTASPLLLQELLDHGITAAEIRKSWNISPDQVSELQEKLLQAFPF